MIIPILHGIIGFSKVPITWALVFLNFFIFISTVPKMKLAHKKVESILEDDRVYAIQGKVYAQFINAHKDNYDNLLSSLSQKTLIGDTDSEYVLSSMALKDPIFLSQIENLQYSGDSVAFNSWRRKLVSVNAAQNNNPSYSLGVNAFNSTWVSWLTYQFVHSDFLHFLGNMFFLLVFGSALELLIGGVGMLTIYLGAGIFSAIAFIYLSGSSLVPLIGASGAISGILAFYCVLMWSRPVRYFWIVGFSKGYMGFIFLPAWGALLMWGVSDLGGYISEVHEFSGVAYAAHLGGEFVGALMGVVIYLTRYNSTPLIPRNREDKNIIFKKEIF